MHELEDSEFININNGHEHYNLVTQQQPPLNNWPEHKQHTNSLKEKTTASLLEALIEKPISIGYRKQYNVQLCRQHVLSSKSLKAIWQHSGMVSSIQFKPQTNGWTKPVPVSYQQLFMKNDW